MTTHHGNAGTLKAGANAVGELKNWTIEESIETADDSAIGDVWKTHLVGQKKWNGDAEVHWDGSDTGQQALTIGASVTIAAYPEGASSGDKYYTGTATVTKISRKLTMTDIVSMSISFEGNGALSEQTVGA